MGGTGGLRAHRIPGRSVRGLIRAPLLSKRWHGAQDPRRSRLPSCAQCTAPQYHSPNSVPRLMLFQGRGRSQPMRRTDGKTSQKYRLIHLHHPAFTSTERLRCSPSALGSRCFDCFDACLRSALCRFLQIHAAISPGTTERASRGRCAQHPHRLLHWQ